MKRFSTPALVFLVCSLAAVASQQNLEPKIPPGYQPIDAETETGLWMEFEDYEAALQRSALLIRDEPINRYVNRVACRVTGDYCGDLRIYIVRNPNFNASMSANGVMQIWTGLLVRVNSEDELAAVIGHELAHYTQLHTLERFRRIKSSLASSSFIDLLIGLPVATMASIGSIMSFSREQESEADLLGAKFMAESGYDPHAAARVWQMVVTEEEYAVAKRQQPGMFSRTHPNSAYRIDSLNRFIETHYPDLAAAKPEINSHVEMLNRYYPLLMEDQIDTNRFGRTEYILQRHLQIGVNPGLVDFFHGEMYRQRGARGDLELAQKSYERAIAAEVPLPDAFRNLGYVYLKQGSTELARTQFRLYLERKPDADDRAMIEFYLED